MWCKRFLGNTGSLMFSLSICYHSFPKPFTTPLPEIYCQLVTKTMINQIARITTRLRLSDTRPHLFRWSPLKVRKSCCVFGTYPLRNLSLILNLSVQVNKASSSSKISACYTETCNKTLAAWNEILSRSLKLLPKIIPMNIFHRRKNSLSRSLFYRMKLTIPSIVPSPGRPCSQLIWTVHCGNNKKWPVIKLGYLKPN